MTGRVTSKEKCTHRCTLKESKGTQQNLSYSAQLQASHLIDDALEDDKESHSNSMQAEKDVIAVHWVHSIGILAQELLLCRKRDVRVR